VTQTLNPAARLVTYIRTSKDEQDKRSQSERVERWLAERKLKPVETLQDSGARDQSERRPQFQKLLALVAARSIDAVVVSERDRLGFKDAWEYGHFIHTFRMNGVQLWCVAENKELTSDDRFEPILASLEADKSKHEQKSLADRTLRAKVTAIRRGEWVGGKPPYGYDLVAKDPHGVEVYRLVYEPGQYRRVCHYPNGVSKRFDGKNNLPGRDKGVVVYAEITRDKAVIAWVRKMYEWFNQGMGVRAIAAQLNDLKVPALYTGMWLGPTITHTLQNSIYWTGVPCWNKAGGGRHLEYLGGQQVPVPKVFGHARKNRVRDAADFVMADQHRPDNAIIDKATWDATQERWRTIKNTPKTQKRPRSKEQYFAGLLYCGDGSTNGCGKAMSSWAQQQGYRCSTNTQYKRACRCNKTRHDLIEGVVIEHLKKTEPGITWLRDNPEQALELFLAAEESDAPVKEFTQEMTRMWREAKKKGHRPAEGKAWTFKTLRQHYGSPQQKQDTELAATIAAREQERGRLIKRMGLLDDEAAKAMAERINELTAELSELRQKLKPREDRLSSLRDTLVAVLERTRLAREALEEGLATTKREAVRKVIAKIVVEHRPKPHGKQMRSDVVGVRIIPHVGPPTHVTGADFPGEMEREPGK
jgi:DNA invertase Pin-like site-specific DNA recombinase